MNVQKKKLMGALVILCGLASTNVSRVWCHWVLTTMKVYVWPTFRKNAVGKYRPTRQVPLKPEPELVCFTVTSFSEVQRYPGNDIDRKIRLSCHLSRNEVELSGLSALTSSRDSTLFIRWNLLSPVELVYIFPHFLHTQKREIGPLKYKIWKKWTFSYLGAWVLINIFSKVSLSTLVGKHDQSWERAWKRMSGIFRHMGRRWPSGITVSYILVCSEALSIFVRS